MFKDVKGSMEWIEQTSTKTQEHMKVEISGLKHLIGKKKNILEGLTNKVIVTKNWMMSCIQILYNGKVRKEP